IALHSRRARRRPPIGPARALPLALAPRTQTQFSIRSIRGLVLVRGLVCHARYEPLPKPVCVLNRGEADRHRKALCVDAGCERGRLELLFVEQQADLLHPLAQALRHVNDNRKRIAHWHWWLPSTLSFSARK